MTVGHLREVCVCEKDRSFGDFLLGLLVFLGDSDFLCIGLILMIGAHEFVCAIVVLVGAVQQCAQGPGYLPGSGRNSEAAVPSI